MGHDKIKGFVLKRGDFTKFIETENVHEARKQAEESGAELYSLKPSNKSEIRPGEYYVIHPKFGLIRVSELEK